MKYKVFRLLPFVVTLAIWGALSCSEDDPLIHTGGENEIVVSYVSSALDTADLINDDAWDKVDQASIRVGLKEIYTAQFGAKILRTKAISDNENVYLRINWADDSQSDIPGYWSYHDSGDIWTQNWKQIILSIIDTIYDTVQVEPELIIDTNVVEITDTTGQEEVNALNPRWEKEDQLAIIWDDGGNGDEGANCATMCHTVANVDTMYLTGGGRVDLWIWRAGRTAPLALCDDLLWETDNRQFDDFTSNHESWQRNAVNQHTDLTEPRWSHTEAQEYHGKFLLAKDTVFLDFATLVNWAEGDGVPGYVLTSDLKPSEAAKTSRYDVKAKSEYDPISGSWTVVLWRKLDTGNDDDIVFESGKEYEITMAVMDHTDNFHSGSEPIVVKF